MEAWDQRISRSYFEIYIGKREAVIVEVSIFAFGSRIVDLANISGLGKALQIIFMVTTAFPAGSTSKDIANSVNDCGATTRRESRRVTQ
jgi:hypothetical protein